MASVSGLRCRQWRVIARLAGVGGGSRLLLATATICDGGRAIGRYRLAGMVANNNSKGLIMASITHALFVTILLLTLAMLGFGLYLQAIPPLLKALAG